MVNEQCLDELKQIPVRFPGAAIAAGIPGSADLWPPQNPANQGRQAHQGGRSQLAPHVCGAVLPALGQIHPPSCTRQLTSASGSMDSSSLAQPKQEASLADFRSTAGAWRGIRSKDKCPRRCREPPPAQQAHWNAAGTALRNCRTGERP